jgi:uncharacterized protein
LGFDAWSLGFFMKLVLQDNDRYILRFDKGEDAIAGIADFMTTQKITACTFTGLGSCTEVELGFYNPFLKEYRKKPFLENLEVIALTGNGSLLEGKVAVHAHGIFGTTEFLTIGGHVFRLMTSATCEVHLTKLAGVMERKNNPEFNLNLLV